MAICRFYFSDGFQTETTHDRVVSSMIVSLMGRFLAVLLVEASISVVDYPHYDDCSGLIKYKYHLMVKDDDYTLHSLI